MDDAPIPSQKKGLGGLAWLGIGCGGAIACLVILVALAIFFRGPQLKQFGEEMAKDPTRATATTMVKLGFEMVAEDEQNKRYTVREKATGKLTTIYWDAKARAPKAIPGDFSAIPADANPPSTPSEPAAK